ncbi:SusD/RagB family nutrient-binding outer membrane lipoprotein [Nostoc ellipsosporum NOK]|jgi:hypothetical protein|nr:SusD/RagB family nutrient-binding outer membrane lipoprotein [Nostoc ellipsosporum NOK]
MTKKYLIIILAALTMGTGCKKYLDINSDPDTTQNPSNRSVLPQTLSAIPTALQSDGGLYVAKFVQNWLTWNSANQNVYDAQGYAWSGGTMAATWTLTYLNHGPNINYIIDKGLKDNEPQYVGVALALKAWSFLHTTDYNSDIPFTEAFKEGLYSFKYDSQAVVYKGVDSLCRLALQYLDQGIARGNSGTLTGADFVYSGNLEKWKKFVYGTLARVWHHQSNKATYKADSVIKYVNNAMTTVDDDFCVPFDANLNNNANYFGTFRDNARLWRQSTFIVGLLDGTTLAGSSAGYNRDPRMSYMLAASQDTTNGNGGYRGVEPGVGDPYSSLTGTYAVNSTNWINARKRVAINWGDSMYTNPSANVFENNGKYLFKNKAVYPVMTLSEMQFIKAEAAFIAGDRATAYTAYRAGIQAHFDFINRSYGNIRGAANLYNNSPISATNITRYLNSANVKQSAGALTRTDIMLQKYIALWAWGFFETWVDMRRYHYLDLDPDTGDQVYKSFKMPVPLSATNDGKPVYRVRPHFTSEYTYNRDELNRIGALQQDYHTKEMWFSQP